MGVASGTNWPLPTRIHFLAYVYFTLPHIHVQVHKDGKWSAPTLVTDNEGGDIRFADMVVDAPRNRIVTVMEVHRCARA